MTDLARELRRIARRLERNADFADAASYAWRYAAARCRDRADLDDRTETTTR